MPEGRPLQYPKVDPQQRAVDKYLALQQQAPINYASAADVGSLLAAADAAEQNVAAEPLGGAMTEIPGAMGGGNGPPANLARPRPYREPTMTDAPVSSDEDPNVLLDANTEESTQQPRHETTALPAGYIDPVTNDIVIPAAPGVAGEFRVRPDETPNMIGARLRAMAGRFSGADSNVPGQEAASPDRTAQVMREIDALRERQVAAAPARPGGPLTTVTESFVEQQGGPVLPATQARLDDARGQERRAQLGADQAEQGMALERAGAFGRMADAQAQQAAQLEAQQAEEDRQLAPRLQAYNQALETVASRRIDPNQVFGGFAGRMGAAIAVALGALGEGLGGGPNRALEIINGAIERNIRAQEIDLQTAQNSTQMRGQAVQQMREILGDRRAAQAGARTMHHQALLSELDGLMATAQGSQLMALQTLRNAVQDRLFAEQQVVAEESRMTIRRSGETVARARGVPAGQTARGQYRQAATSSLAHQSATQLQGAVQAGAEDPNEAANRLEQLEATGSADTASLEAAWDELYTQHGIVGGTINGWRPDVPSETAQAAVEQAHARRRANPNDRQARAIVDADRRRRRADAQRMRRAVRPLVTPVWDREEVNAAIASLEDLQGVGEGRSRVPSTALLPGLALDPANERAYDTYVEAMRDPGSRERLQALNAEMHLVDELYVHIMSARRENDGGELLVTDQQTRTAQTAATALREYVLRAATGAGAPVEEYERFARDMPDPATITTGSALDYFDNVAAAWRAFRTVRAANHRARLRPYGLVPNSRLTNGPAAARAQAISEEGRRRAAQPQAPQQAPR